MVQSSPIRDERLKQVYACVGGAGDAGTSIQDVAKCIQKTVSPYLTGLLDELVKAGYLRKEPGIIETGRGARMGWRYFVVPESGS